MKQIACEMCGSTDLIKENGLFVCQSRCMGSGTIKADWWIIKLKVSIKTTTSGLSRLQGDV